MEQVLLYIAAPVTVIYLAQIIMTFMGMDSADGISADFDSDLELDEGEGGTLQLFTVKNAIAFLMGLSWGGLIALNELRWTNQWSIIGFGIGIGLIIIAIQLSVFFFMSKLERKQSPSLQPAIGEIGSVYLTIPQSGKGKVTVNVNGTSKTLDAITNEGTIPTGKQVKVTNLSGDLLVVETL
jgi:membrane-bound ClpP family serine protease